MGKQLSPRHAEGQRAPFTSPLVPAAFPGHPLAGHTVIGSMAPPRRRQRVETKTEPPPPSLPAPPAGSPGRAPLPGPSGPAPAMFAVSRQQRARPGPGRFTLPRIGGSERPAAPSDARCQVFVPSGSCLCPQVVLSGLLRGMARPQRVHWGEQGAPPLRPLP